MAETEKHEWLDGLSIETLKIMLIAEHKMYVYLLKKYL